MTSSLPGASAPQDGRVRTSLLGGTSMMSTSKAFLVLLVVPRIHRVYIAVNDQESEGEDKDAPTGSTIATAESSVNGDVSDGGSFLSKNDPVSEINSVAVSEAPSSVTEVNIANEEKQEEENDEEKEEEDSNKKPPPPSENDLIVGYVTGEDEKEPVEHVVTVEEMAAVVKITPATEKESDKNESGLEKEQEDTNDTKSAFSAASTEIKRVFGFINRDKPGSQSFKLSKEEAMAAIKEEEDIPDDEAPNTEIKLEELIRLTFKALLSEGHLLNAPIYTSIKRSSEIDGDEWIELSVMVKAQSIGITMDRLERIGVGSNVGTVSIYKAELCRTAYQSPKVVAAPPEVAPATKSGVNSEDETTTSKKQISDPIADKAAIEAARAEWMNAASRLRVEQVKEQIAEQASFSFDFLALLSIASILAGIGLIVDNTVVIVASMLVSPIMGPVMGITFGSRVRDWALGKKSAIVEVLALLLSVAIGAIIGVCSAWTDTAEAWPTNEMSIRGETSGLLTGIAVAIPSGMGVALSILGNNTASLVGVAISASLLPPAVNAGICWIFAILLRTGAVERTNNEDFAQIGTISFLLTVINIVCIWGSGMLMFAIKEVAPTKEKSAFWSRDIKVARKVNVGSQKDEVDIEVLRAGLQSALEKEQRKKEPEQGKEARLKVPSVRRTIRHSNVTFNMAVNPVPIDSRVDTKHVKKIGLDKLAMPGAQRQMSATLGDTEEDPASAEEQIPGDVRYYSLEDMAHLLDFEEEDEEYEDVEQEPTPPPSGWRWGWIRDGSNDIAWSP